MKKLLVMLLVCLGLVGCGNQKGDALVIGVDDTFAPMGFRDENNELVGFDIDLANAMAKKMDTEIKFQPIDWSMKETELNGGNIDLIWNGYTITDKRKEQVNFTEAYLNNKQVIVVLSDSDVKTKEDLKGKVISLQKESSALEAVNADVAFVNALKDKPIEFDTNIECFMDLEAKRSDAIVCDEVLARYVIKQRGEDNYKVLEDNFGDEEYGIGVRKEDKELLDNLNKALNECKEDGTYKEIYNKWFAE